LRGSSGASKGVISLSVRQRRDATCFGFFLLDF
jgi:hypothetical protein